MIPGKPKLATFLTVFATLWYSFTCIADQLEKSPPITTLRFIGEALLPPAGEFKGTTTGGFSGIDYHRGLYYLLSDDPAREDDEIKGGVRYYTAELDFDAQRFHGVQLTAVVELTKPADTTVAVFADPESVRIDPSNGHIIWSSEGFIDNNIAPFIREHKSSGEYLRDFIVDPLFIASTDLKQGPRHNASFEGLSLSVDGDGYWVAMEGPLKQDGVEAQLYDTESPVRVAYIDKASGEMGRQFAVELDPVARQPATPGQQFSINGIVDILEYDTLKFLVLERSFATNHRDGGNDVKLYKVDASQADDIRAITAIANININKAAKTLLFDFESIREKLTDGIVDNIEGLTFGPPLANGNQSLVVVADDNFSQFSRQLNQFIAFEIIP